MSMLSLTWMWTFISTVAGGGVHGEGTGTAHGTMTPVGAIIKGSHPFMAGYRPVGGMTTGIIVGKGIGGTTNEYLTNKFNRTGGAGKRAGVGRRNKPGVSKACNPEGDHHYRLERCNHLSPDHN